jgi:hypothetical protein
MSAQLIDGLRFNLSLADGGSTGLAGTIGINRLGYGR